MRVRDGIKIKTATSHQIATRAREPCNRSRSGHNGDGKHGDCFSSFSYCLLRLPLLIKYDPDYRSSIEKPAKTFTSMIRGHYVDDVPCDTN